MRLILILLTCLWAVPALAECERVNLLNTLTPTQQAQLDTMVAQHPFAEGNHWRATKGGSEVHIVGTVHLFDPRLAAIIEQIRPAVETADALYLETTEDGMKALEQKLLADPGFVFITEGPTLPDLLEESEWKMLSDEFSKRGIPGFMAAKMQPWYAMTLLAIPPCAMEAAALEQGLDAMLMDLARGEGIETRALEDAETALRALTGGSREDQLNMLRSTLVLSDNPDQMFSTLIEAFFDGEHRALWEFNRMVAMNAPNAAAAGYAEMFAEVEQQLLIDRNLAWMELLLPQITEGRYVIAVGAAHLSGETGVLNGLAKAGYTLEQVAP